MNLTFEKILAEAEKGDKDSQYEYTVDDVIEDPETGEAMIALRLPEDPRFKPPAGEDILIKDLKKAAVLGEDELVNLNIRDELRTADDPEEEIFFIDQEDRIVANYIFYEDSNSYIGMLYDCRVLTTRLLNCVWIDEWGDGESFFTFSKDFFFNALFI